MHERMGKRSCAGREQHYLHSLVKGARTSVRDLSLLLAVQSAPEQANKRAHLHITFNTWNGDRSGCARSTETPFPLQMTSIMKELLGGLTAWEAGFACSHAPSMPACPPLLSLRPRASNSLMPGKGGGRSAGMIHAALQPHCCSLQVARTPLLLRLVLTVLSMLSLTVCRLPGFEGNEFYILDSVHTRPLLGLP